jgi:hypothetical protein
MIAGVPHLQSIPTELRKNVFPAGHSMLESSEGFCPVDARGGGILSIQ